MENFESQEDHLLLNRNMIQILLAEKHGEDMNIFVERHAKEVSDYIDSHQEILERFDTNPEGVIEEVERVVYH